MFLWIRDQKWLPTFTLALTAFLLLGGTDVALQGEATLYTSALLCLSLAFSRPLPWLSIALFSIGLFVPIYLGLEPQISQLSATVALVILAAFANTAQRWVGFAANILFGSTSFIWFVLSMPADGSLYGIQLPNSDAKLVLTVAGLVALVAINANAWFMGRLLFTRITHVGTNFDRALLDQQIGSSQLALAENERRFGIARDVNDILLDQVSSTMATAEAGVFSAKADPTVAPRILENVLAGLRKAHAEIRRLSDLLGFQEAKAFALPGLRDLKSLFISYREFGYGVNARVTGEELELEDGAELVLYRIVFETLDNIKRHTPINTAVDVDFMWQGNALQIVIKDNGEETAREALETFPGYTAEDDARALVERPIGAGFTSMKERAALYGGLIELTRVPGVGFTVSAAFPNIAKYKRDN